MDKSLLDAYSELIKSYYDIDINARDLFNGTNSKEVLNCKKFIKEHFDKGNKKKRFAFLGTMNIIKRVNILIQFRYIYLDCYSKMI